MIEVLVSLRFGSSLRSKLRTQANFRTATLVLALALPMVMLATDGGANSWLEPTNAISKPWDLPFIDGVSRQKRAGHLKVQRVPGGEYHHMPEVPAEPLAASPVAASKVFPPPRAPAPTPATQTAAATQTAPARDREVERQLKRELPKLESPATPAMVVPPPSEQIACAERLAKIARYEPLPVRTGPNGCGAPDLVRLEGVLMRDKNVVAINPPPQIRCGLAEQLAEWVREDVSPTAAAELGAPLASITGNDAYDCRTRNHVKGAKISEHGRGNAFDLATFRLRNGGVFNFTDPQVAKPFRDRVRTAACGRFMTVLGPGSDAYHAQHIHLDMAERSSRNSKVCQWEVRDVQVAVRSEPQPVEPAQQSALAHDPDVASLVEVDSPIADVVSPPLPRRKPEALLARAQVQAQTDGKRARDGWRGERGEWSYRNREFRFRFRW